MSVEPCELHEVSNCGLCSGAAKKFDDSVSRSRDFDNDGFEDDLPIIPGATVIHARHPGYCKGCGRPFSAGTAVFQRFGTNEGWSAASCCR